MKTEPRAKASFLKPQEQDVLAAACGDVFTAIPERAFDPTLRTVSP
jgi:hypothetical protein